MPPVTGALFLFVKETAVSPIIIAVFWLCVIIAGAGAYVLNGGLEAISSDPVEIEHDDKD